MIPRAIAAPRIIHSRFPSVVPSCRNRGPCQFASASALLIAISSLRERIPMPTRCTGKSPGLPRELPAMQMPLYSLPLWLGRDQNGSQLAVLRLAIRRAGGRVCEAGARCRRRPRADPVRKPTGRNGLYGSSSPGTAQSIPPPTVSILENSSWSCPFLRPNPVNAVLFILKPGGAFDPAAAYSLS